MFGGAKMVLVGSHNDAIKGFLFFTPVSLFIHDRVGADALDFALERPVNRRVVCSNFYDGVLAWTDKSDILRLDLAFNRFPDGGVKGGEIRVSELQGKYLQSNPLG